MKKIKILIPCIIIGVGLILTGCVQTKEVVVEDMVLVTDVDFEPQDDSIDISIIENEHERTVQTTNEDFEVDFLYEGIEKEFNNKDLFNECVDKIGKKVKLKMDVTMVGDRVIDYDIRYLIREGTNSGE